MTKSKWYFILPALTLLLIDQLVKKNVAIKEANGEKVDDLKKNQEMITKVINIAIIIIVFIGTLHYMLLQKMEYKENFNFKKFFLGLNKKCKKYM
jgi:cytochrome c biogenesis factor